MNSEKQLEKLRQVFEILEDGKASTQEVAKAFGMVFQVIEALQKKMSQEMKDMDSETKQKHSDLLGEISDMESRVKRMHSDMMKSHSKEMSEMKGEMMAEIERVEDMIPQMPDLSSLEKRVGDVEMREMPKFELPQDLVNEERLAEELEKVREETKTSISNIPRGGAPRRVFIPYRDDLSASCDGANKTFYLSRAPLNDVVFVFGTDFPTILRPTVDFTIANKVLTLTSAVPAPSEGATLLVQYFS